MTEEEVSADDRALIVALAERQGMHELRGPPETPIAVGDGETAYELDRTSEQIAFVEIQRGSREIRVVFLELGAAIRFLVFVLSDRPRVPSPGFAPGSDYVEDGQDRVLTWPGGRAVSPGGRLHPEQAREFSWVATAKPVDIAARRIPILKVKDPIGDPDRQT